MRANGGRGDGAGGTGDAPASSTLRPPPSTGFRPRHATLVAVDSDGCVFDTMGPKQIRCFHPEIIRVWGLERIGRELRETAEFVNLRSIGRGSNRFPALLRVFDLLARRPEVRRAGVALPDTGPLRRFVESGLPFSNDALRAAAERSGAPELRRLLEWSLAVNARVEREIPHVPPFDGARETLSRMADGADVIVVTQTPEEAVVREWRENGLDAYVRAILGPTRGTKGEMLIMASKDRYTAGRALMVGDAPGDLRAAREAGAAFFPILPGREPESWERLRREAYDLFLRGRWSADYEGRLVREFEDLLPATPPWEDAD